MPYDPVTRQQFRTRFPVFDDAEDALVDAILKEATDQLTPTAWREEDYQPAVMYLAAHLLATDNSAEGDDIEVGSIGQGAVKSESLGGLSISYGTDTGATSKYSTSGLGTTSYGRRYLDLVSFNFPPIMVV